MIKKLYYLKYFQFFQSFFLKDIAFLLTSISIFEGHFLENSL